LKSLYAIRVELVSLWGWVHGVRGHETNSRKSEHDRQLSHALTVSAARIDEKEKTTFRWL